MDSKLNINKSVFSKFLTLCSCKGELENKELLLNITTKSLTAKAVSSNKVLCLKGTVNGEFQDWGELGIDNLTLLKNFLTSNLSDILKIKKTENKMMIEDTKLKYTCTLRNPKYIVNNVTDDKLLPLFDKAKGNFFTLKSEDIKKLINYTNTIAPTTLIFSGTKKILTLTINNGDNELEVVFDLDKEVVDFTIKTARIFVDLLTTISDFDITFSMQNNCPIYLKIDNKEVNFEYLFAPLNK
jgi:hypothetical protein